MTQLVCIDTDKGNRIRRYDDGAFTHVGWVVIGDGLGLAVERFRIDPPDDARSPIYLQAISEEREKQRRIGALIGELVALGVTQFVPAAETAPLLTA